MFGYDDTCVKIYDPEEQDPSKKLIGIYDNYNLAGNVLGIPPSNVHKHCSRKSKVFSPRLNKKVAVRLSKRDVPEYQIIKRGLDAFNERKEALKKQAA